MTRCVLCDPDLGPILADGTAWRLVLNRNQNLLGKCMWVLRRHVEAAPDLTPDEWRELHALLRSTRAMLDTVFQPDHYNYAFLQNQDRHVHLHVIPRYASPRSAAGLVFDDPDWPGHYSTAAPARRLDGGPWTALLEQMRAHWPGQSPIERAAASPAT